MKIMRTEMLALTIVVCLLTGCGGSEKADGVPVLAIGEDACAACGMKVADAGYAAAARLPDGQTLAYDAIECLVRDLRVRRGDGAPAGIWLPDFASGGELKPAADMTVVLADYPSPMGGGYAAFADPAVAAAEAASRDGVAGPLQGFVDGSLRRPAR